MSALSLDSPLERRQDTVVASRSAGRNELYRTAGIFIGKRALWRREKTSGDVDIAARVHGCRFRWVTFILFLWPSLSLSLLLLCLCFCTPFSVFFALVPLHGAFNYEFITAYPEKPSFRFLFTRWIELAQSAMIERGPFSNLWMSFLYFFTSDDVLFYFLFL